MNDVLNTKNICDYCKYSDGSYCKREECWGYDGFDGLEVVVIEDNRNSRNVS